MINIYEKTETEFISSGLATLEPIECIFAPMINDVWKLEMTIPYDSEKKYRYIANDCFLRVTDLDAVSEQSSTQLFRIYDFKKQDDSIYVLAYPVGLDARFETLTDYLDLRDKTASQAIALINNMAAKYTVTTDLTTTDSAVYENKNMIEILNGEDGFVHKWGGEICYDNYNIKVNNKLGSQSGSLDVRYGKNILGMDYELDSSNVITRIYPKSQNGDILNYYEDYAYGEERYVDSSRLDPNFIHNYFVEAPYVLTSLNNDGSLTYIESISLYNDIKQYVASELAFKTDDILNISHGYGIPDNLDLNFIKWFYSLTMEEDLMEGYAERVARLATVNLKSPEFKEFAKKAIMDGFKSYFDTVDAEYDWGSFTEGGTQYADGYYPGDKEDWRWHSAWAKGSSAWQWCEGNGAYHESSSTKDTDKWDWYKKKGRSYKRYGNKKKENTVAGNYLQNGLYKINDVWYYFNENGKSTKAKKLFTSLHLDALYDGIATDTFQSDTLASKCENAEAHAFYTLYMQMTDYCVGLLAENDQPKVSMEIDMVDLSKTTEYKGYEQLLKVHLGDKIHCINYKYGFDTVERVIGVEYDVLRGFNRKVKIGFTDSSTINMLNVTTTNETKLVAGDGIEIHNNIISVKPQPSGVKDVIVNGESVVIGDVASFDLDEPVIEGTGLEYFVETEDTLTGDDTLTETIVDIGAGYLTSNVDVGYDTSSGGANGLALDVTKTASENVIFATVEGVLITSMGQAGATNTPAFMILAKNQEDVTGVTWHYTDTNGGVDETGTYSYALSTNPVVLCYNLWAQSGTATVEGDTWYGVFFYFNGGGVTSQTVEHGNVQSTLQYIGSIENPTLYATCSAFIEDLLDELYTTTTRPVYNGIARKNGLAFFAGGSDDEGTDAPIKIWADGTYQGITKAATMTQAEYNALTVAEKMNGTLYIIYANADTANYDYHVLKEGQIIAQRNKTTGDVTWWFVGYSNDGVDYKIPAYMDGWLPSGGHIYGTSYDISLVNPNANVGIYNGFAREWSLDTTILVGHPTWGVVTNSGGTGQQNPYSYPPGIENALYYKGIKVVSSYESGGEGTEVSITPTLSTGTKIADFEIDGVAGALYAPAGGGGGVSDVTVDGTSVVNGSGVAEIDLTGKQDALTPGNNIQIQNGTISATDTTYSDFAGSAHGLVPPALSGDSGKFLKGDGTWAEAGGGGGGSDTKVTQTPTTSSDSNEYPLLLKHSSSGSEETDTAKTTRDSRFTYNPNTNSVSASSYNNGALVRKAIYGSIGLRTQGSDIYGRPVNAEYLQDGLKLSRESTHTAGDLTDVYMQSEIEDNGSNYKPVMHFLNKTYDDTSLDAAWEKSNDISHEGVAVYKERTDSDYSIGFSEATGAVLDADKVELYHTEYSQSGTPTVNKSLQVGVDDITNSSTWDGSHTSLIAAIANAGGGGGGASVSLLTKSQYDALTPAQKTNGTIYFVYATADPNYEYRVCKDGQIIVQRNKTTGDVTWWFVGYSNGGNDWLFPQDMQNYNWMPTSNLIYGVSYDSDKVTQNANIGVYNGYAREWDISTATLSGVTTWGVVTNSGGQGQNNPWSEPPDSATENAIYYMGYKFSAYDIS